MENKQRKRDKKRDQKQKDFKMTHKSGKDIVSSKMSENLKSSKFRFINEKLYTSAS